MRAAKPLRIAGAFDRLPIRPEEARDRVQVSRIRCLVLIMSLAMAISFGALFKARLELKAALRELGAVTRANESLRETLGNMAVAIVAKDREIDHLVHSPCETEKEARPDPPIRPDRQKANKSNAGI